MKHLQTKIREIEKCTHVDYIKFSYSNWLSPEEGLEEVRQFKQVNNLAMPNVRQALLFKSINNRHFFLDRFLPFDSRWCRIQIKTPKLERVRFTVPTTPTHAHVHTCVSRMLISHKQTTTFIVTIFLCIFLSLQLFVLINVLVSFILKLFWFLIFGTC